MKISTKSILLFLLLGLLIYLYRDIFFPKKNVCNEINISNKYYSYLVENNLLDSLCEYSNKVEEGNFIYVNKIFELDESATHSMDTYNIIKGTVVNSDKDKLKIYFNNTDGKFRLIIYTSLKISSDDDSNAILKRIIPVNNGNDFYFN